MSVGDFLFGGVDKSQQRGQANVNRANTALALQQAQLARDDVMSTFGPAQRNLNIGAQNAMDYIQDAEARKIDTMQGGMSQARKAQLGGLEQIQNAILGNPVDFASLQQFGERLPTPQAQTRAQIPEFAFSDEIEFNDPGNRATPDNPQGMALQGMSPHKDHWHDASGRKFYADDLRNMNISGFGGY